MFFQICAACLRAMHDNQGDTRNAFGVDFDLCEPCSADWDLYGIPASIAADYIG